MSLSKGDSRGGRARPGVERHTRWTVQIYHYGVVLRSQYFANGNNVTDTTQVGSVETATETSNRQKKSLSGVSRLPPFNQG